MSCHFCQDEARVHKLTKRLHTLDEVNINVKLLTEMLSHYNKDGSTESDKEILKVCVCTQTQNETVNLVFGLQGENWSNSLRGKKKKEGTSWM